MIGKVKAKKPDYYRMQALDMWAATHSEKVNRVVYAVIETVKKVDSKKLKHAISQTIEIIPEILTYYDPKWCILRRMNHGIEDIVMIYESEMNNSDEYWDIDIFSGPMLKVHIFHAGEGSQIRFCLSHIISDARGLIQYLELVCKFYNDLELLPENVPHIIRTDIYKVSKRLKTIEYHEIPELEKYQSDIGNINLPFGDNSNAQYKQICVRLEADDVSCMHKKAKKNGATMNDLFLTAFLRTLSNYCVQERYVIHCPLDMRKLLQKELEGKFSICNITSKYICPVEIAPGDSFDKTLSEISRKMTMQKKQMPKFAIVGTKFLFQWEWLLPDWLMAWMLRRSHTFYSVYYTNCGILNENTIFLTDNEITAAYVTGGFEKAPGYHLSPTTFKGSAVLVCNMIGSSANLILAEEILQGVKNQVVKWINE